MQVLISRLAKWTVLKAGAVYLRICQAAVLHETWNMKQDEAVAGWGQYSSDVAGPRLHFLRRSLIYIGASSSFSSSFRSNFWPYLNTPAALSENQHGSQAAFRNPTTLTASSLVQQPSTMEEACADGNLELVKESFKRLLLSSHGNIPLTDRVMPGGAEVIQKSTCIAARHGHTAIFTFLLDIGSGVSNKRSSRGGSNRGK